MQDQLLAPPDLTPKQAAHWHADVTALRDHLRREQLFPLRLGDLLNEMRPRWENKLPQVAQAARLPPPHARDRARVSEPIPPDSPLRRPGLPYSILRLLSSVSEAELWSLKAVELQEAGKLRVRDFARRLEEAGARKPRARRL